MSTMNMTEIAELARRIKGTYNYYKELKQLKSDMDFFKMYIERNKQSKFDFILIPRSGASCAPFKDIFEAYCLDSKYIESVFDVYVVMEAMIMSVYYKAGNFEDDKIKEFSEYMLDKLELCLSDYVHCFIGCSSGVDDTLKRLNDIIFGKSENT